jgi:hypothetical protein
MQKENRTWTAQQERQEKLMQAVIESNSPATKDATLVEDSKRIKTYSTEAHTVR